MRDYVKRAPERPFADKAAVEKTVREMLGRIRDEGDAAVCHFAKTLDNWEQDFFRVSGDEVRSVTANLPETFKEDFALGLRKCNAQTRQFTGREKPFLAPFFKSLNPLNRIGMPRT